MTGKDKLILENAYNDIRNKLYTEYGVNLLRDQNDKRSSTIINVYDAVLDECEGLGDLELLQFTPFPRPSGSTKYTNGDEDSPDEFLLLAITIDGKRTELAEFYNKYWVVGGGNVQKYDVGYVPTLSE